MKTSGLRRGPREGDFIETRDKLIFDVKGVTHPPDRVIAFLRYYPSERGDREKEGTRYQKVYSLDERFKVLKEKAPSYIYFDRVFGSTMQGVLMQDIEHVYEPIGKLAELSGGKMGLQEIEKDSLEFCKILSKSSNMPLDRFGVTGSILVGLQTRTSDIDVVVYGTQSCLSVYEVISSLYSSPESQVRPYTREELKKLFKFRSSDTLTEWRAFLRSETRRRLQGTFKGREYFLRFVKDRYEISERYGDITYKSLGNVAVEATVTDDSESLFTPCIYRVSNVQLIERTNRSQMEITEISSFRGRFCEVARNGERVIARGKLELVTDRSGTNHSRLIIGAEKQDFLVLVDGNENEKEV